ncbi:substrate-binding domain-containing protein [Sediminicola luteus]|uniref:HTH lacI-type domain-containing protein n=1 Tax=Sediminicola luteus TaxID=319238 RepID=A0A2A4G9U8_9FLAO|nr:substrate-binding domain-containing protein [Sediminicola luteus]PCE64748.1 hypothetical protein B7P33_06140 [Sediminicola luteus]
MITIKEIAQLAGVSPGTVDRVIHGRGGVSKKTEAKIKALMEDHNFTVNKIARSLAIKKKYVLGVLMPAASRAQSFWASPLEGVQKASEEVVGFGVMVHTFTFDQSDTRSYMDAFATMLDEKPDAIVLVPTFKKETALLVKRMDSEGIPFVFLNIDLDAFSNISYVGQHSYQGGTVAGQLMQLCVGAQGKVLIAHSRTDLSNFHNITQRIRGFQDYLHSCGGQVSTVSWQLPSEMDDVALADLETIIGNDKAIRGIFVPTSRVSYLTKKLSENILAHLQIIGFDTTPGNIDALKEGRVTMLISQKSYDQGYRAVESMSEYLLYKRELPEKIFSPIEIVTKENVGYLQRKAHAILS